MTVTMNLNAVPTLHDGKHGIKKFAIRDFQPTGTYVTGGNVIGPHDVGMTMIENVEFGTQVMTGGTAGATGNWIGVTYNGNAPGSVTFQQYECAATGLPGLEKTNGEAVVTNATARVMFVGH